MHRQTLLFILVFLLLVPIGSYKEPQNKVVEASSVRTPPSYFFDFGGARTPVERGWTQVKDTDRYNRSRGYGLLSNVTSFYVTRRQVPEIRPFVLPRSWVYNTYANEMTVDGVRSTKSVLFRVDLPNGTYRVRIWIGDLQRAVYSMNISVNGKWVVEEAAAFHIASRSVYLQPFNYGFRVCYSTDVSVEDGYLLVNVTGNDTAYWSRLEEERRRDPPYSYLAWMSQGIKKYSSGSGPWRYIGGPFTNASVMGIEVYPRPDMPVEKVGKRLVISPTVSSSHIISAVSYFNAGDLVSAFESWNSSLPENLSGVNLIARAQVGLYLAGSLKLDRELDILPKVEADLSRALREQPRNTGIKELLEDTRKMRSGLGYYITRTEYGKNHFQECDKAISLLWTIHPNEPLYPKAMLWCSRALFSLDPHRWTSASGTAKDIMNSLRDMDPNNVYIRFYLDTDYYSPPTWENNLEVISTTGERDRWYLRNYTAGFEDAPSWARILHEELCWLYDITDWWVDHRMKENGYLGGGWTDDVEFIGLFGFNALISRGADNKSLEGARRFVEGMLQDGGVDMERGFSAAFADAEHSAELTGDSLPMMIAVDFGNPRWLEFSMKTAVLMRDLWMGVNEKGFLQFKSNYLSATKIGIDGRAEDSWINYRATLPARWVWWYSSNKDVETLFLKWAENWVQAALSTEKGKPYGVIPADIGWPDGEVGGHNAPTWYKAAHPPGTVNYDWEPQKYKGYIVDLLVSAYEATGNLTYLEPLRLEAELANEWKKSGVSDPAVGSRLWAGKVLYTKGAVETYQKILNKYGLPGSDPNPILWTKGEVYRACIKGYNYIRKCYPLMTTEASATDRVAFVGIINPFLIYTGGSVGGALLAPSYTYTGLGRDFAAMVKYANRSAGEILLYGFFDGNRNAGLIPWDLQKGATYRLTGGPDLDGDGEMDTIEQDRIFTFSSRGMEVNFTLPGRREYILKIEKMEGADELSVLLPDPAWGDEEVIVNAMNNSVDITLHNVGSADCGRFNVTLVNDNDGEIVAREVISYLSAPRNLQPSIFNFSLKLLREEHYPANYTLIINPGGTLQEITPFNNIKKVNLDLTSLEPLPQNRAPTGPARINITLKAGENYLFSLPFSDPDGDQLIVEVLNNTAWMEISHNLTLTFSPPCNLSGVFYVTLNISDGNGSYLLSTLIITVKPPLPPSLSLPDNITLMERESASFNISTGVDYPCNFSIRISNYRWAVLRNGTLTICPIDGDAGKYVLTVEAYLNENIHSVYNITVVILKNWTDFKYHIAVEPLLKIYYINSSVNFSVSWSGYNGPLKFYWILLYDNNTVFNISKRNITVHLTREGIYSMILYLEDYGVLYSQNLNVTEIPSPTGEKVGEKEKKGNWVLYVVGLLLGIAIIVISLYIGKSIGQNIEEE